MNKATATGQVSEHLQSCIAIVLETSNGEASRVVIVGEASPLKVEAHTTNVPWLEEGDQVMISHTPQGVIVTHRLRRPQESPSAGFEIRDGVAYLDKVRAIQLKAGKSMLELSADGRIRLDGNEIVNWAERRIECSAAIVEIN